MSKSKSKARKSVKHGDITTVKSGVVIGNPRSVLDVSHTGPERRSSGIDRPRTSGSRPASGTHSPLDRAGVPRRSATSDGSTSPYVRTIEPYQASLDLLSDIHAAVHGLLLAAELLYATGEHDELLTIQREAARILVRAVGVEAALGSVVADNSGTTEP